MAQEYNELKEAHIALDSPDHIIQTKPPTFRCLKSDGDSVTIGENVDGTIEITNDFINLYDYRIRYTTELFEMLLKMVDQGDKRPRHTVGNHSHEEDHMRGCIFNWYRDHSSVIHFYVIQTTNIGTRILYYVYNERVPIKEKQVKERIGLMRNALNTVLDKAKENDVLGMYNGVKAKAFGKIVADNTKYLLSPPIKQINK